MNNNAHIISGKVKLTRKNNTVIKLAIIIIFLNFVFLFIDIMVGASITAATIIINNKINTNDNIPKNLRLSESDWIVFLNDSNCDIPLNNSSKIMFTSFFLQLLQFKLKIVKK